MKKELDNRLYDEFPDILNSNDLYYGIECGNGWFGLLYWLCSSIEELKVDIKVVQVKEKFGSLRFYYDFFGTEEERKKVKEIVSKAESMSAETCELCGAKGERRSTKTGWIATLCDSCLENNVN